VTPDVTVVIVSWNTREHLARCLAALEAAADGLSLETIVVDNGSTDGSQAMVTSEFPHVRLIQSPDNIGFGRACNVGAAVGTGRAVLVLNSDCEPAPGSLGTLCAALDADAARGAVFARLVNADGTLQPSVHAALPTPWTQAGDVLFASSLRYAIYRTPGLKRVLLRRTLARHAAPHDVAWGGAACVLVRRDAFEAVGGFDPRFFMYMEDVDLCARLGAAGFRLRYVPDAVVVHHWGVATAKSPGPMLRHAYLSRIAYFDKHFPGWGGAVAGALATTELAVRRAALGLAGVLTRSPALRARAQASTAARGAVTAAPRARLAGGPALALIVALVAAIYAVDVARMAFDSPFIDFAHYYVFTLVVEAGGDVFDPAAVAPFDARLGLRRAGAPGNYPPLFYVLMQPWTAIPFRASALVWLALSQVLLLASAWLVTRQRPSDPWRVTGALVLTLTFQPLLENLFLGQANVVVLFLLTVGWFATRSSRPWLAGIALGLLPHVKPQLALVILLLALLGQGRVAARASLVAAAGLVLGLVTVGLDAHSRYAQYVLNAPAYLHGWSLNYAPHAVLHRLFDRVIGSQAAELLTLLWMGGVLLAIARLGRHRPAAGTPGFDWAFGLALAAVALVSPLTEEHHLVPLLLPLALLVLVPDSSPRGGVWLVVTAVLVGARYSLDRFPVLHTGLPSVLLTGKTVGIVLLAGLLARRLRATTPRRGAVA
jgi:GT2 family glycosyltransferase